MNTETIEKYSKFEECFGNVDTIFDDFGSSVRYRATKSSRYIYLAPKDEDEVNCILLVAHLDTVLKPCIGKYEKLTNSYVDGAGFDDRSGFCAIMNLYKSLDNVGVLLTDNEETGASTSTYAMDELMEEVGLYNLIVELDREGSDYVTYSFSNGRVSDIMEQLGVNEGTGSFSDICNMNKMGIMAINLGIGCYYSHQKYSVQSLDGLNRAISIVKKLSEIVKDEIFPDSGKHYSRGRIGYSNMSSYYGYNYYDMDTIEDKDKDKDKNKVAYTDKGGRKRNIYGVIIDDEIYDSEGYDYDGYDYDGFGKDGYDIDGYDKYGLNEDGYDRYGYDKYGYDREGYDYEGFDCEGFNEDGFDYHGRKRLSNKASLPFFNDSLIDGELKELA